MFFHMLFNDYFFYGLLFAYYLCLQLLFIFNSFTLWFSVICFISSFKKRETNTTVILAFFPDFWGEFDYCNCSLFYFVQYWLSKTSKLYFSRFLKTCHCFYTGAGTSFGQLQGKRWQNRGSNGRVFQSRVPQPYKCYVDVRFKSSKITEVKKGKIFNFLFLNLFFKDLVIFPFLIHLC